MRGDEPMGTAEREYAPATGAAADVQTLLRRVADLVGNARQMPLSTSVMLNRDEVLELVEEAVNRLPEELRAARWLLRERQEFLTKVEREGDEILEAARIRAERMVQRTEVVRAAQAAARRAVEDAEAQARRLRHEAEDFCDQKLAQFEIILDRTVKTVQAGRARLQVAMPEEEEDDEEEEVQDEAGEGAESDFYDQDSG